MNPIVNILGGLVVGVCVVCLFLKTYGLGYKKGFDTALKTLAHIKIMEINNERDTNIH